MKRSSITALFTELMIVGSVLLCRSEVMKISFEKKLKKLLTNIERCDTIVSVAKESNKQE
jgi:hypothetical protein